MPSYHPSHLYHSPQIKGYNRLSFPVPVSYHQLLTMDTFFPLYTCLGPCLLTSISMSSFAEHWMPGSGDWSFSYSPHSMALGTTLSPGKNCSFYFSILPFILSIYIAQSLFALISPFFPESLLFIDWGFRPWSMIFHLTFYHDVIGHSHDQKEGIQHPGFMVLELLVSRDAMLQFQSHPQWMFPKRVSHYNSLCLSKVPPLETQSSWNNLERQGLIRDY